MSAGNVHLYHFIDFTDIFIRYSSKQSLSKLSLIATEMVFMLVFYPICSNLQSAYFQYFQSFNAGFFSCCTLTHLVNMA